MKKILIIEDDIITRSHLISTAKKINPEIEILNTASAKEALDIAKSCKITAFFIDINLIDYSGFELAKQLRKINKYYFSPIIFITGVKTKELETFKQIHCYDYIIKPFNQNILNEIFRKILIDYIKNISIANDLQLNLKFKTHQKLINQNDIIYIEYTNRKIIIHTTKE